MSLYTGWTLTNLYFLGYSIVVITGDSKSLELGSNPGTPTMIELNNKAGVFRLTFADNKEYIVTAMNMQKKFKKLSGFLKDKELINVSVEEEFDSITDKELSNLEEYYIKKYNTEEPNGYNKAFTKAKPKPKEEDNFICYKRFYFYQKGKETYLVSAQYYPNDCPYFNLNGHTLKELIEDEEIYMSDNEEIIKQILWKHLKQD